MSGFFDNQTPQQQKQFRELWSGPLTIEEIANMYGCGYDTVGRHARRLGLASRNDRKGDYNRNLPEEEAVEEEREPDFSQLRITNFWTVEKYAKLLQTGGKWSEISDLATEWGRSIKEVTSRFHEVRRV